MLMHSIYASGRVRPSVAALVATLAVTAPVACTSDPAAEDGDASTMTHDTDTGDSAEDPFAPCPPENRVGRFEVGEEGDYSAVSGSVADGVFPNAILEEVANYGACRLMRRNNPFCDPPCPLGETCDHDGSCVPAPENHAVGTVSVDGLVDMVVMEPTGSGHYFDTTISHPAFVPGSRITLDVSGGDYAAFRLEGRGVDLLPDDPPVWSVERGQPLTVLWPTGTPANTAIMVLLNIDQHGATPVTLTCISDDTGSLEISSEALAALFEQGISGFPSGHIYRTTVDSTTTELGCVEFAVLSHRAADVSLAQ